MTSPSPLTLKLPVGCTFADLKLRRCADDAIDLDMDLVKRVCQLNGLDFGKVCQDPGPVVSNILSVWYKTHLSTGGAPDAVMEALIAPGQRPQ
ncbi:hypothetical protein [Rhodoferax sp.]|uniref:hypothetical protein n=1 Tax=Rhodoferax sp. TaxID=50421 RepID=UPI00262708D7|nr:hypothetical protein [Rhodoferax sp.]MDD5478880.1 hypothetical protein [Rhodoferax sp.]